MRKLLIALATFFVVTSASAQQEVILDNVTNSIGDSLLIAGNTHIINIRYSNFVTGACISANYNPNTGFKLYSPDGASWNRSAGSLTPQFVDLGWTQVFVNHFEDPFIGGDAGAGPNDGISPDYLGFAGVIFFVSTSFALQPGFDEIVFQIEIESNLSDSGLQICIDSSSIGRLNEWKWSGISRGECNVAPDWGGPYCFTIVACCQGSVGNVDFDDAGIVDISDLTVLIDHLFINFPPLLCEAEANIDGDPAGTVDITDLTALIDHLFINFSPLPACQ